jgi:hypothetical protein
VTISEILSNTVHLEMGIKNEKLQYKLQKFYVSQQEIMVANNKYLPYDRTGNATTYCYTVNYISNNKLKHAVHISQKYGEFKCL